MFFGDFICLAEAKAYLAHSLSRHLLSIIFVLDTTSHRREGGLVWNGKGGQGRG